MFQDSVFSIHELLCAQYVWESLDSCLMIVPVSREYQTPLPFSLKIYLILLFQIGIEIDDQQTELHTDDSDLHL
jgi:hypothetical protein